MQKLHFPWAMDLFIGWEMMDMVRYAAHWYGSSIAISFRQSRFAEPAAPNGFKARKPNGGPARRGVKTLLKTTKTRPHSNEEVLPRIWIRSLGSYLTSPAIMARFS